MRQRLIPVQRTELVLANSCDFGIDPNEGTTCKIDLVIDAGLQPVVILTRGTNEIKLQFDICVLQTPGVWEDFSSHASVLFCLDEDPTASDEVFVVLTFWQYHIFQVCTYDDLRTFLEFPYEDGLGCESTHEDDDSPEDQPADQRG